MESLRGHHHHHLDDHHYHEHGHHHHLNDHHYHHHGHHITMMIITIITIITIIIAITSMLITPLPQVRVMEQRLGEVDWSPSERSARAEELQREAAEKERVIRRLFAGGDHYLLMVVIIC